MMLLASSEKLKTRCIDEPGLNKGGSVYLKSYIKLGKKKGRKGTLSFFVNG